MVQAGAEGQDRQLAALVWLPGRGLCGGMGRQFRMSSVPLCTRPALEGYNRHRNC